ncbi:TonB-dependent receptor domain-containing protein [Novosphingobium sp. TH158]|uniref:TonB-dependent receptor domain-containing protein n=1 Tax=Novosphingobium sp. TH158 TaxID=2067455 RepID=UPI0020B1424F|nr:TonB-dependent receptor [Novosphingobium sp. TH158]
MKKTTLSALKAGSAPLVLGLALISTQAAAQDAADEAEDDNVIVVTGSLIKNPNLVQANPVNVTTSETIELKQSNLAEEVLREIPGFVPNIGSAVNNGNGGSSYVDLRGLGSTRNVVLLDGNRIVPVDLSGRADLNNIPLALISRVDSQTGAAVTTYGADAITGVVNFVTKKDFAGVDLSLSDQITEKGDGNFFRADLTVGANFEDGRGNAVLSIGYQKSDPVYQGDRDFSIDQISSYTGGAGGSGTSVPSRFAGTRPLISGTTTPNTTPESLWGGLRNPDGTPIYTTNTGGASNGGLRQVNAAGAGVGTFAFFNFNPYNIFQTPFKRYNIFAQANYEISDSVEVYTRGLFSKNTVSTIIAPSGSFGGSVNINLNNPFLPATLRNQFCAFDVNPRPDIYTPRFDTATCAAAALATGPSDPRYRVIGAGGTTVAFDVNNDGVISAGEGYNPNPAITFNRRSVEVGPRVSDYSTTTFDYRVGLRGRLTDSIDWDVNASYGESEKVQTIKGYTLQSRWRQGALVDGTAANPVCTNTANGCVPINLFGDAGSITPAMAQFLTANSTTQVKTALTQVRGLVSGDLPLNLATNPVSFALGAEYRDYTAQQASDTLAKTPGELGGAGGAAPDINGGYNVWEAYAELVAPLVEDAAFAKSITLDGGVRYSKYKIDGAGSTETWTYKAGLAWEINDDLKLRGNYAHAVRAPNIFELFNPLTVGLTNLGIDPCAGTAPVSNANLRAICLAQGAPLGTIGSITNPTAAQANIATGGNLNLTPETANTWTVGAVFQPSFLPRFSMSVDYYNIKVTDVIGAPLPGDLISACFGSISASSATNPACTVIRRNPITGGLDGDPAITQGLFAPLDNLGKLSTDGIDLVMNYNHEFGDVKWSSSFTGNWTNSSKFQATPTGLNRECVGFYSVNCSFTGSIQPKWQFSWRNTLSYGKFDFSLLWRWVDSVQFEPQQLADDAAAADAANRNSAGVLLPVSLASSAIGNAAFQQCPNYATSDDFGCMVEPEFRKIKAHSYFDITMRWNVNDNFTFTFGVQNLLNKKPPIVGNTIGSTSYNSGNTYPSTYDALGRRFAVSGKVKF